MEVTTQKTAKVSNLMIKKAENNLGYLFDLAISNPELAKEFFTKNTKCEDPYPHEAGMLHLMGCLETILLCCEPKIKAPMIKRLKEACLPFIEEDLKPADYIGEKRKYFKGKK